MKLRVWCFVLLFAVVAFGNSQEKDSSRLSITIEAQPIYIENSLRRVGDIVQNTFPAVDSSGVMRYALISKPLLLPQNRQWMFRGVMTFQGFSDRSIALSVAFSRLSVRSGLDGALHIAANGLWWLRLWDTNILPVPDDTDPNGLSTIQYFADESFQLDVFDVYVAKSLKTEDATFMLVGGIRLAHPSYRLNVEERQHLHQVLNGVAVGDVISFNASSVSDLSLCGGPLVGLGIQKPFGKWAIEAGVREAVLYSEARYRGEVHVQDGLTITGIPVSTDERMAFEEWKTLFIGITEISCAVSFRIFPQLRIGVGGIYSVWNMPRGPLLSGPWDLQYNKPFLGINPQGLGWRMEDSSLKLYGGSLSVHFQW